MTKADIVKKVVAKTGFPHREAFELVEQVLELVKNSLQLGQNVKISNFGTFTLIDKDDRPGRNPHTGEEVTVTARRVVHFRPSSTLKQGVNQGCN